MLHSSPLSLIRRESPLASASATPSTDGLASRQTATASRAFPLHMYASVEYDRLERSGLTRRVDPIEAVVACAALFVTMTGTLGMFAVAFAYAMGWL